jgi:CHAD domain-containing protein
MRENLAYILPDGMTLRRFRSEISDHFTTRVESPRSSRLLVYDSFDWRLYKKHLVLIQEDQQLVLLDILKREVAAGAPWDKGFRPGFWWDLPEGPLRRRLASLLDVRTLIELQEVSKSSRLFRLLNHDEKSVVRFSLDTYTIRPPSGKLRKVCTLELEPIRGYLKDLRAFQRFLKGREIPPVKESVMIHLLREQGLEPGGYSSKFRLELHPEAPSAQALREILRYLIDIMKRNENGIRADLDTEFLHDYRVAIRRIRSALSQIKGVFPQEAADEFRNDFRELGQTTNMLRDLDVYLLKKAPYRSLLPGHLAPGLDSMFRDLTRRRKREQAAVVRALDSAGYRKVVRRWERFLEREQGPRTDGVPHAETPILELAQAYISKRYRRVLRAGGRITDASPDEDLHRLRISCKKLRYLLEFFASLFPPREIERLIGQLKKLQDNLGDFNDLYMQQLYLREFLEGLDPRNKGARATAAAIGGLITCMHQRQNKVRREFQKRFRVFSNPENRGLFKRLFQPSTGSGAAT